MSNWRKSAQSHTNGCVEVAFLDGHVQVRDSKQADEAIRTIKEFTPVAWQKLLDDVRKGVNVWWHFHPLVFNRLEREAFVLDVLHSATFNLPAEERAR